MSSACLQPRWIETKGPRRSPLIDGGGVSGIDLEAARGAGTVALVAQNGTLYAACAEDRGVGSASGGGSVMLESHACAGLRVEDFRGEAAHPRQYAARLAD